MTTQARDYAPSGLLTLERIAAASGRLGAQRIYRFPNLATTVAAGGVPSNPVNVTFRADGYVIGLYGTTLGATPAEAAGTEVAILMSGTEDLVTDGDAPSFASFRSLFGDAQNWFPLERRVTTGQVWSARFRNFSAGAVTPRLQLAVIELPGR